ncbi:NAD-dependent deacylase [bacterium]|nr:MAG: NAD-dependent deacylase [bacterium]
MENKIRKAALLLAGGRGVALTGAGISVESGIPDFRSKGGLWSRFDPNEYATIGAFRKNPAKVWKMLEEMDSLLEKAVPNRAHEALARLEKGGLVEGVITQNIDSLHQKAGSSLVVEFHGSTRHFICLWCEGRFSRKEVAGRGMPPLCDCGKPLKPGIVFFGETIPGAALHASARLAENCRVMLVIGTSAEVAPANALPLRAKRSGAAIVEINVEPTRLTRELTDIYLEGRASEILAELERELAAIP